MPVSPTEHPEISTEVVQVGDQLRLRTRVLRVEVVSGPNAGQVAQLDGPEVRVGSGRGVDLPLIDTTVSRHHFTLHVESRGVRVRDAGSRNGTALDGVQVVEAWARPDSLIVIGNTTLRLRMLPDVIELPLSARERFGGLLGRSAAMRRAFTLLERIAPTDDTVLLEGETGTGKEIAAEALHEESARAAGPFVVFDCSAVAASLIESELFGHVRGAFTGAVADRVGAVEAADGGTLFLDEIGELPLELQPKLLRALERREVRRVGSNAAEKVDVRIVAATHRNLAEEAAAGRFREDLLYRLAVVRIRLPPLRERPDDIALLARHFAALATRAQPRAHELSESVLASLRTRPWPGNVRELRNAVARTLSLGGPDLSEPAAEGGASARDANKPDFRVPLMVARDRVAQEFEEAYLRGALEATGGNASRAAELAGVNRKFMQRAIKRYRLRGGDSDT